MIPIDSFYFNFTLFIDLAFSSYSWVHLFASSIDSFRLQVSLSNFWLVSKVMWILKITPHIIVTYVSLFLSIYTDNH